MEEPNEGYKCISCEHTTVLYMDMVSHIRKKHGIKRIEDITNKIVESNRIE